MKIRFSAGHGKGKEYNRGGIFFNEGDENYNFTGLLMEKLNEYENVDAKEIRHEKGNIDFELHERAAYGRGADIFYSSHSNADSPDATGVEVILSYQSLNNVRLAEEIAQTISDTLGIKNRGVKFKDNDTENFETKSTANRRKTNWYGELRNNKARCAMIVEHFFHTNSSDSKKYLAKRDILAENIAKVIANFWGLRKKKKRPRSYSEYLVKNERTLNIRKRPNGRVTGQLAKPSVYTIVETDGKWGKLKSGAGWIYLPLTKRLDNLPGKKSIEKIAKEVLEGKWGNGDERKRRLKEAGYDYLVVQEKVNELI